MIDFQWLEDLVNRFPDVPVLRKNLLSIAGFPDWEQVNSNLLAFYFNPEEEHQFKDLFLQSLLDEIEAKYGEEQAFKRKDFSSYSSLYIMRELSTKKGKRIDIVIENKSEQQEAQEESNESQWAIIIENKVEDKVLDRIPNDLGDYWRSVASKNTLGVVLTLYDIKDKSNLKTADYQYVHITHGELSKRIKNNLPAYFEESDDRHLLFLKEYLANMATFYENGFQKSSDMEDTLNLFQQHRDQILELKKMDERVLQFVSQNLFKVMRKYGFDPNSKEDKSKGKHFYAIPTFFKDMDYSPDGLRFWVWMDGLRYYNTFDAVWELYSKENTQYGPLMREFVDSLGIYSKRIIKGQKGYDKGEYCHLIHFKIKIDENPAKSLEERLDEALKTDIFEHPSNYIRATCQQLAQLKKKSS